MKKNRKTETTFRRFQTFGRLAIALVIFLLGGTAHSQSFTVFDIDTTDFPIMRAKVYAFDENGEQITNLSQSDFDVIENGEVRDVISISCPDKETKNVSVAMSFDISGSMKISTFNELPIDLSKKTAQLLCEFISVPPSEIAIQSCNQKSYLIQDFTTDQNKIFNSINNITAIGGNDYNEHLLNQLSGLLNVAKKGKNKRVAVLYTDAWWHAMTLNEIQECKDICEKNDIVLFTVVFSEIDAEPDGIKTSLNEISIFSGGKMYDGITSEKAANDIAGFIQNTAQGGGPCTIEWMSEIDCEREKNVEITCIPLNKSDDFRYRLSTRNISQLEIAPNVINYGTIEPDTKKDTIITITANKGSFNIVDVELSNQNFSINPKTFSLNKGESINLTLTYFPKDSSFNYCEITVKTDKCDYEFHAIGGSYKNNITKSTIKLLHPNGDEVFVVGSDTVITWEGLSPEDKVKLDYSTNSGKDWINISEQADNLLFKWNNIPNTVSDNCLMKVSINDDKELSWSSLSINGKSVSYSPDYKMIAFSTPKGVTILDAISFDPIVKLKSHKSSVNQIDWNPDGVHIATCSEDKTVRIWNIYDSSFKIINNNFEVKSIKWNNSGDLIAIGNNNGNISIYNDNGIKLNEFKYKFDPVYSMCWSPDDVYLASGNAAKEIIVWDPDKGTQIKMLSGHSFDVNSLDWDNSGTKILSGSADRSIKIWDFKTGKEIMTLNNHNLPVSCVRWSPDNSKIASSGLDKIINIWDAESGILIKSIANKFEVNSLDWNEDGSMLVSTGIKGELKLWDMTSFGVVNEIMGHSDRVNSVSWSPDGSKIASGSSDGTLKLWNVSDDVKKYLLIAQNEKINCIAWSPDGKMIASGCDNGVVKIWDAETGVQIGNLNSNNSSITCISWSPDGSKIASGSNGLSIIVWDVLSNTELKTLTGSLSPIYSLSWSPDGNQIASGSAFGVLKIWDYKSGLETTTILGHTSTISSLQWSKDGKKILSGSFDDSIKIWDIENEKEINTFLGHSEAVKSVDWSSDENSIISGSFDKTIKMWDVESGYIFFSKNIHNDCVSGVEWSPDGQNILSGSFDCTVKIMSFASEFQKDISDKVWSIVLPEAESHDIDMKQQLVGSFKDSVIQDFIINTGSWQFRVDTIYFKGPDSEVFSLVSGFPEYIVQGNTKKQAEIRFAPLEAKVYNAEVVIITQADTLIRSIRGEGVKPKLEIVNNLINFGDVYVGEWKDTLNTITIKNIGNSDLEILNTKHNYPNDVDYSTLNGGGNFVVKPGKSHLMDLRFSPSALGGTSGTLEFYYDGIGSPAVIQLFGTGIKNKPDIAVKFNGFNYLICDKSDGELLEIFNPGKQPLEITEVQFSGLNPDEFSLDEALPVTIKPDSIKNLRISFNPHSTGNKSATIEIKSNADPDSSYIMNLYGRKDSAALSFEYNEVNFATIFFDETIDTTINIKNTGNLNNIGYISGNSRFNIDLNKVYLTSSQNIPIHISFSGSNVEELINEELVLVDTICNQEKRLQLKLRISSQANASISTIHLEGYSGNEINIPIILNEEENIEFAQVENMSLTLTFNPTLLDPMDYNMEFIDEHTAKIRIDDIPLSGNAGDVLKNVRFKVGLGNAEECDLILSDALANGGNAEIDLISGKFKLLGVCYEGGTRLLNPYSEVGIQSISPNPAEGEIEIEVSLIESGWTELSIYNTLGEKVETILSESIEDFGERTIKAKVSDYSSGLYFIVLKTPTVYQSKKVMIMR